MNTKNVAAIAAGALVAGALGGFLSSDIQSKNVVAEMQSKIDYGQTQIKSLQESEQKLQGSYKELEEFGVQVSSMHDNCKDYVDYADELISTLETLSSVTATLYLSQNTSTASNFSQVAKAYTAKYKDGNEGKLSEMALACTGSDS